LAFEYSLERTEGGTSSEAADVGGAHYSTHFLSLQWSHVLSPRSSALLEAGFSLTPNPEEAGLERRESFYGGATYSRQVKRSSLTAFARREVTPAFGFGVSRLENRFGLSANVPIGREWTLQLTATHVGPEVPEGAGVGEPNVDEAFLSLGRRLGRSFLVSAETRFRRRGEANFSPVVDQFQAGIFLSLVSPTGAPSSRPVRR
jgi:hypothetical protein